MDFDLAACLRAALQSIFPGDEVDFQESKWTVKAVHEDRTLSLSNARMQQRVLLRDCKLKVARGRFCRSVTTKHQVTMLESSVRCELTAQGHAQRAGSRVREVPREGCHYHLEVARSQPVPADMQVCCLHVEAEGMDQGWGNTGDSGLLVYLLRSGTPGDLEDDVTPIVSVVYDRRRSSSLLHRSTSPSLEGPYAPQPGDVFQVVLRCPNYPGWRSHCSQVCLVADCEKQSQEELPGELSKDWQALSEHAFYRLWAALGDSESFLSLDSSHLSLAGQEKQKVFKAAKEITSEDQRGPELLMECVDRIARPSALPRKVLEGARRLLQKLAQNDSVMGAPRASQERSKKYRELACLIHQTLDHVETDQPQVLEAVLRQYAECVDDCIYRWEREIHNMHDMVTGEATCDDALDAEDAILRVLYNERRQMAEGVLHSTKGALQSAADMHFESHFYASVHFGLAEQLTARQDPHRLTYLTMDSGLRADQLKARLLATYTPTRIREVLRREVVESKAKGSQALREKLLDWLKLQVPPGFRVESPERDRRESWLHSYCHDEEGRMTDEALNYMLCRMHILSADSLVYTTAGHSRDQLKRQLPSTEPGPAGDRHRCRVS